MIEDSSLYSLYMDEAKYFVTNKTEAIKFLKENKSGNTILMCDECLNTAQADGEKFLEAFFASKGVDWHLYNPLLIVIDEQDVI